MRCASTRPPGPSKPAAFAERSFFVHVWMSRWQSGSPRYVLDLETSRQSTAAARALRHAMNMSPAGGRPTTRSVATSTRDPIVAIVNTTASNRGHLRPGWSRSSRPSDAGGFMSLPYSRGPARNRSYSCTRRTLDAGIPGPALLSFSEANCTDIPVVTGVVQSAMDTLVSEVLCTKRHLARESAALEREGVRDEGSRCPACWSEKSRG